MGERRTQQQRPESATDEKKLVCVSKLQSSLPERAATLLCATLVSGQAAGQAQLAMLVTHADFLFCQRSTSECACIQAINGVSEGTMTCTCKCGCTYLGGAQLLAVHRCTSTQVLQPHLGGTEILAEHRQTLPRRCTGTGACLPARMEEVNRDHR
eukprot:scaffold46797_cov19-Tisochrysis_lutea.AAC.5